MLFQFRKMLLAVNIGNSNIRFALVQNKEVVSSWTINTKPYKTAGEFFMLFQQFSIQNKQEIEQIKSVVVGSVVPLQTQIICKVLENILKVKPIVVDRNTPSEVKHKSHQMGTDLYANAVSAHYLYPQKKKIIVDFGTALTLTGINEQGEVQGVIIAPGVMTSLNALVGGTAQLPHIELKPPKQTLGHDTETCMQSGIINGYSAMVQGLVDKIKKEFNDESTLIIITGGLGHIYFPLIEGNCHDDKLHTIKGLCILHDLLSEKKYFLD